VFDKRMLKKLSYWISERDSIRSKKEAGAKKPWTKDLLLRNFRWCNVRRMDDKVSRWLLDNWYRGMWARTPHGALTLAALGRLFNWPNSLANLGRLKEWDSDRVMAAMAIHREQHGKIFTGAYIINGGRGGDKIVTVCNQVTWIHDHAKTIMHPHSMEVTWHELKEAPGIGSFMAGQIVADLRWFFPGKWSDRLTWAPLGPGSTRGMRRLLNVDKRGSMKQHHFDALLPALYEELMENWEFASVVFTARKCEAMDLQNCLCEFDKYVRLSREEGHVRSRYPGAA
jgi:hypothetical protein